MHLNETAIKYTYMDYASTNDDNRYELIDGVMYLMSPGVAQIHQDISVELLGQFRDHLKGKPCKLYHPPFDVCLNAAGDDDTTVVQPDLFVVCDKSKLDGKRCNGAPDLVIEILSPSTIKHDRVTKLGKYLQAGVREYWIVDPESKIVSVHILKEGEYIAKAYTDSDNVAVYVLEGCSINMKEVFTE